MSQLLQNSTKTALDSIGLAGNPQGVARLLAVFGPVANVALIDYGLMVASLTASAVILVLVLLLTDVQRYRTLPFWSNVVFLGTACINYLLLIVSYYTIFLGRSQSLAVIILFCIFGSVSRTISDWTLMLRVRKSFPKANLLLLVGLALVAVRFAMELVSRIIYNIATVNEDSVTFFMLQTTSPTALIRIYPWFTAAMDAFFTLAFIQRFFQKLAKQRDLDENIAREMRWYRSIQLMAREQNILPAIASTIIAIMQAFSLDPNRYAAISLLITVLTTPFATVWRMLEKKLSDGDPSGLLMPLAKDMAEKVGRPMNFGDDKLEAGTSKTAAAGQANVSNVGDKMFEQMLGFTALSGAETDAQLQQAAFLGTGGSIGIATATTTAAVGSPAAPVQAGPLPASLPRTKPGAPVVTLADAVGDSTDTVAFKVIKVAADGTTVLENSMVGQTTKKAAKEIDESTDKIQAMVGSNLKKAGKVMSGGATSPKEQERSGLLRQISDNVENAGAAVGRFVDGAAAEDAEFTAGEPVGPSEGPAQH